MHKIIRNSDGSAYVIDHKGKHIATHDSATEAQEHMKELNDHIHDDKKKISKVGHELNNFIRHDQFEHHKLAEKIRHEGRGSHDPYYENSKKNK